MSSRNLKLFLIGFFALIPIFISIDNNLSSISLDRIPYYDNQKFLFTVSLNLLFSLFFFRQYIVLGIYKTVFSKIFFISIFLIFLKISINFNLPFLMIKNIMSILVFVFYIYISYYYFKNKVQNKSLQDFNYLYGMPSLLHMMIIIFCERLLNKHVYLFETLVIYNFEQYLAFVFIPILCFYKNWIIKIISFIFLAILTYYSLNFTVLIVLLIFVILKLIPIKMFNFKSQTFLLILLMQVLFFLGFFYPYLVMETPLFIDAYQGGLISRLNFIKLFFINLDLENILFPFLTEKRFFNEGEFHSQYLNLYYAFGVFIFYLLYKCILFIKNIYKLNADFALACISILFISSFTVNILLHPFTLVCFAILVGFLLSLLKMRQKIKNIEKLYEASTK